jgi:DNA-binding GntR family transcriptional regulator
VTIAEYIETDLRQKIKNDGKLPTRLTLSSLASEYEVSLTPVRLALENLICSKHVLKGQNGRLTVNTKRKAKKSVSVSEPESGLPQHNWDEMITEDIIHLSIQGESAYLREESSAQKYGIGRTIIRQVFNRLAGAGLIEHVPRRGWRVHPFREQDMLDYIDIRETLELKALKLARKHLDPEYLKVLLAANSPDSKGTAQLNNELHSYWIEKSGNRYIRSFFAQSGIYYSYLFSYSTKVTSVVETKAKEHRKILRALLKKDWDSASKALREHIRLQRPNVTKLFERIAKQHPKRNRKTG